MRSPTTSPTSRAGRRAAAPPRPRGPSSPVSSIPTTAAARTGPAAGSRCSGTCSRPPASTRPRRGPTCSATTAAAARASSSPSWTPASPIATGSSSIAPPTSAAPTSCAPYDFVSNNRYPLDRNGHGTFVAGILAESTNNGIGLTGLAYGASIMPIRVLDCQRRGRRGHDRARHPLRGRPRRAGHQPQPRVPPQPGQLRLGDPADRQRHRLRPPARGDGRRRRGQRRDRSRSPTRPAPPASSRSGPPPRIAAWPTTPTAAAAWTSWPRAAATTRSCPASPTATPSAACPSIYQLTLTSPPHWNQFGYPSYYIGTSMSSPEVAAAAALVIASRVIGPHPTPDQILAPARADGHDAPHRRGQAQLRLRLRPAQRRGRDGAGSARPAHHAAADDDHETHDVPTSTTATP